ncbi:hypothetical protein DJFAAGMI_00256 [Comamonas sp. PE63]|uniref:Uncharacterized protein n=1 Tax=Comamonas brasiliensis TaxID=1812482 RepID=A0ABS5LMD6_9BURK|nr:hypothetical protein [Comamonas sp. PE63]MBS3017537.1 hypothetical protein [Comamonas sp. PE63]
MPVLIRDVNELLAELGLQSPDLSLLQATHQSYRAFLLQPAGPIYADIQRIGPKDLGQAVARANKFLEAASARGDQLAVTPEYFLPIESLLKAAKGEHFPKSGALWVLGCESMTPAQLTQLKQDCAGHCDVLFESDDAPGVQGNYFDPVAYCFVTRDAEQNLKRVILIQFKTAPSRDDHGFENKQLRCGQTIYRFEGRDELIKLSTIICSDALSLDAAAIRKLSDRTILIHVQLNPKPKHDDYRRYRTDVFSRSASMTNCDIVCLNWAQDMEQYEAEGKTPAQWRNESGSAWYLPDGRCSVKDDEILSNEAKGLYYTRHEKKRHVLHFHYDEAVFALTVPKVVQDGLAVHDVTVGPLVDARFIWDAAAANWVEAAGCPETGWTALINTDPDFAAGFENLQDVQNRLHIERAISLSCGPHKIGEHWHRADKLDVCQILESEIVGRATLQLDRNAGAAENRQRRLGKVAALGNILLNEQLPQPIKDLGGGGASISWSPQSPNTNVTKEGVRPALVAYLGESPTPDVVKNISDAAFELLRKEGKAHKNRVAVCYRTAAGKIKFADIKAQTDIAFDGSSMTSITGGE